jgi:hypothetical protein
MLYLLFTKQKTSIVVRFFPDQVGAGGVTPICVHERAIIGGLGGRTMRKLRNWIVKIAVTTLVIVTLLSAVAIVITARNLNQGISAMRNVYVELSYLELTTGDDPEIQVSFDLRNESPLELKLRSIHFSIDLNGNSMGNDYLTERTLDGFEVAKLNFVIPVHSNYLQHIEQAEQMGEFKWFVRGRSNLELLENGHQFSLDIREQWSRAGDE